MKKEENKNISDVNLDESKEQNIANSYLDILKSIGEDPNRQGDLKFIYSFRQCIINDIQDAIFWTLRYRTFTKFKIYCIKLNLINYRKIRLQYPPLNLFFIGFKGGNYLILVAICEKRVPFTMFSTGTNSEKSIFWIYLAITPHF